jgi:hypothetical protein
MPRLGRQLKLCSGSAWQPRTAAIGPGCVKTLHGKNAPCCGNFQSPGAQCDQVRPTQRGEIVAATREPNALLGACQNSFAVLWRMSTKRKNDLCSAARFR